MKKLVPALAVLWLLFIWGNSLQTAAESSQSSMQVLDFLVPLFEALKIPPELRHNLVRKAAHMAEFGVLGLLWAGALCWEKKSLYRGMAAFGICAAAAAIDETIQLFVPGRGAMFLDVCIDAAGALMGVAVFVCIKRIWFGCIKA